VTQRPTGLGRSIDKDIRELMMYHLHNHNPEVNRPSAHETEKLYGFSFVVGVAVAGQLIQH